MLSLSCPAARIVSIRRSFNLNSAVKNAKLLVMSHRCLIYPSMRPHEPPTGISTGCDSPMLRRQDASSCHTWHQGNQFQRIRRPSSVSGRTRRPAYASPTSFPCLTPTGKMPVAPVSPSPTLRQYQIFIDLSSYLHKPLSL